MSELEKLELIQAEPPVRSRIPATREYLNACRRITVLSTTEASIQDPSLKVSSLEKRDLNFIGIHVFCSVCYKYFYSKGHLN